MELGIGAQVPQVAKNTYPVTIFEVNLDFKNNNTE